MHALATVFTKNYHRIGSIIDYFCERGDWDYANIGGRYWGLIPVGENVKDVLRAEMFGEHPAGFPFAGEEPRPRTKYVTCARFRNIIQEEVERMELITGGYSIFRPEMLIIDNDGDLIDIQSGDIPRMAAARDFINRPNNNYWYMIIVDYHY